MHLILLKMSDFRKPYKRAKVGTRFFRETLEKALKLSRFSIELSFSHCGLHLEVQILSAITYCIREQVV